MVIRKANISDAQKLQALVLSLANFYLDDSSTTLPEWFLASLSVAEFENRLSNPDFTNFVTETDSELHGYISIKSNQSVYHLFVAEAHQGSGVARALWQHVQDFLDAPIISLRSSIFAIPVYRKLGFTESGALGEKDGILFQPMELRR